jgi:hypothetical protein
LGKPGGGYSRKNERHVLDRLTSTPAAALAVLAAVTLLVAAFGVGRLTAPSDAPGAPALSPVHGTSAPLSLPHLSQAMPLAALAATPAPVTRPAARIVVRPRIHRSKPKKPGGPVDIVGSG